MTEFHCRSAGPFDPSDLYELSALLCRQAPTWDSTLVFPSPMHLARAMVRDHPGKYFSEAAADEAAPEDEMAA
jgi:hypothetical protein